MASKQRATIWRAELERVGVWSVQKKLDQAGPGHGALVRGFVCGDIERGFIEEWLSKKERAASRQLSATLRWARIAGLAAIVALVLTVLLSAEGRQTLRIVAGWLGL
jgi:hypothetical protein